MKMKFKELPKFWKIAILTLTSTAVLFTAVLASYIWCSVGELFMVMF